LKFSHKIAKLGQPLTYRRTWRRIRRILYPIRVAPLLAGIDQDRLRALQAQHGFWSPDASAGWPHYAKYLDLNTYLPLNIRRVQDLNLQRMPPCHILDIGCGGGLFLIVAQALGHHGLGLDTGDIPVFDALVDLLSIERTICLIKAFEPLPDFGLKFDLITAFSTAFHGRREHSWCWGGEEWDFLIRDLKRHLKSDGRIFFGLNPADEGNYYTPDILHVFLKHGGVVERENVLISPRPEAAPGASPLPQQRDR
jgi:SAM-dependent methyltransferase